MRCINIKYLCLSGKWCVSAVLLIILVLVIVPPLRAANLIYADIAKSSLIPQKIDTVYIGGEYEFRIWLENDINLGAFYIDVKFSTDDSLTFNWVAQSNGYGIYGPGTGLECVTVVPGCRMDPPEDVWDLAGFLVGEYNTDGVSPEKFGVGGCSLFGQLPAGPLEHMVSIHFRLSAPYDPDFSGSICTDTFRLIGGDPCAIFSTTSGSAFPPESDVTHCWPVKLVCGDPNGDGRINVGDPVFLINFIFRGGRAPVPWQLGDANWDGKLDVGDIVFLVKAAFRQGPQPQCPE